MLSLAECGIVGLHSKVSDQTNVQVVVNPLSRERTGVDHPQMTFLKTSLRN